MFLGVVHHPVGIHGLVDDVDLLFLQDEDDRVADKVAVFRAEDELLGNIAPPICHGVDCEKLTKPPCVRPFNVEIRHVERLVEQNCSLAPGFLLVPPIGEFRLDRELVRARGRVPEH